MKVKNLRKTGTRQALFEGLGELLNQKDFEKITIQDLTEKVQINRATFYAHFSDKYELLDEIIKESASKWIEEFTLGNFKFDEESVKQLVYAVSEYHRSFKGDCKRNYDNIYSRDSIYPPLRSHMMEALCRYLDKGLSSLYQESERSFYARTFASAIYEAGHLLGTGQTDLPEPEIAGNITRLLC